MDKRKFYSLEDARKIANEGTETVHIIRTHGHGHEIMPKDFYLSRQYYHGEHGEKEFFTYVETIEPDMGFTPMTQEVANKLFATQIGYQLNELYSTSDGRAFIRYSEAEAHANGKLDDNTKPLEDKTIQTWFPEGEE